VGYQPASEKSEKVFVNDVAGMLDHHTVPVEIRQKLLVNDLMESQSRKTHFGHNLFLGGEMAGRSPSRAYCP
jgi:hypothetical protein